jgi:hypothetical protein
MILLTFLVCGRSFLIKEAVINCEEVDYSNE